MDGSWMDGQIQNNGWMKREKDKILERPQAIGHPSLFLIHHYN